MPAVQTASPPTFESVWAAMQEVAERQKETDRIIKEVGRKQEEYAENLKESQKETDRLMKESREDFNRRLGSLTNLFGDVTEAMIAPKICEKFNEFGFSFLKASPNPRYNDRANNISFEVDIMLENGEKAMLIEAKTKLTTERVDKHILRLEKMRKYADLHGDKRIFQGAVAGIVLIDEVKEYALSQGFYFIEYTGDNFFITPPSDEPKEW